MSKVKTIFDSYTLNRMIIEFSWTKLANRSNRSNNNTGLDYIKQNYMDIFLNPEFIKKDAESSSFVEIDILNIYNRFFETYTNDSRDSLIESFHNPTPKSMDYLDSRLFATPPNILQHILNEKRLSHSCLIYLESDHILFDCNFEQLTLIMGILERTFEHNPLHRIKDEFSISTMMHVPKFNTHSFIFTFNLTKGVPQLFGASDIREIMYHMFYAEPSQGNEKGELIPLEGYEGIFFSLVQGVKPDILLQFHVSNKFTKSAMLFDNTAIRKTSLLLLDYIFKTLIQEDFNQFKDLNRIRKELEIYIT